MDTREMIQHLDSEIDRLRKARALLAGESEEATVVKSRRGGRRPGAGRPRKNPLPDQPQSPRVMTPDREVPTTVGSEPAVRRRPGRPRADEQRSQPHAVMN